MPRLSYQRLLRPRYDSVRLGPRLYSVSGCGAATIEVEVDVTDADEAGEAIEPVSTGASPSYAYAGLVQASVVDFESLAKVAARAARMADEVLAYYAESFTKMAEAMERVTSIAARAAAQMVEVGRTFFSSMLDDWILSPLAVDSPKDPTKRLRRLQKDAEHRIRVAMAVQRRSSARRNVFSTALLVTTSTVTPNGPNRSLAALVPAAVGVTA